MRDYDEKRGFRRLTLDCVISVHDATGGRGHEVAGRDLSAEGISFIAEHEFAQGQILEVRIKPAAALLPPLHAEIEVLRASPEGNRYLIAATIRRTL